MYIPSIQDLKDEKKKKFCRRKEKGEERAKKIGKDGK